MAFDSTYLIGIVRNHERHLLEADEYTRLINAPTVTEALAVLIATPYGQWLPTQPNVAAVLEALDEKLYTTWRWLIQGTDSTALHVFMSERYDALNVVQALLAYRGGLPESPGLSRLGLLPHEELHSAIWEGKREDVMPARWRDFITTWREASKDLENATTLLLTRGSSVAIDALRHHASTPLQHQLAIFWSDKTSIDNLIRFAEPTKGAQTTTLRTLKPNGRLEDIIRELGRADYNGFTVEMLQELNNYESAVAYEQKWDAILMQYLRQHRADVMGDDALLAYWLTLELEVKSIRLLLLAKAQGFTRETLQTLQRPLFRHFV